MEEKFFQKILTAATFLSERPTAMAVGRSLAFGLLSYLASHQASRLFGSEISRKEPRICFTKTYSIFALCVFSLFLTDNLEFQVSTIRILRFLFRTGPHPKPWCFGSLTSLILTEYTSLVFQKKKNGPKAWEPNSRNYSPTLFPHFFCHV